MTAYLVLHPTRAQELLYQLARAIESGVTRGRPCVVCDSPVNAGGVACHEAECVMRGPDIRAVLRAFV